MPIPAIQAIIQGAPIRVEMKAPQGARGAAATIAAGTTTTLSPGSLATVVNVGTSSAAVFNFGIPRGATGATGATGAAGANGGSSTAWRYRAKTNATSGYPTNGHLLWNNATQLSATEILVSHLNDEGSDIELFLSFFVEGQKLFIQNRDDSSQNQVWRITGTPTVTNPNTSTAYYTFPVTLISSAGAAFTNNHSILFGTITEATNSITSATTSDGTANLDVASLEIYPSGSITFASTNSGGVVSLNGESATDFRTVNLPDASGNLALVASTTGAIVSTDISDFTTAVEAIAPNAVTSATTSDGTASLNISNLTLSQAITSGLQTKMVFTAEPTAVGDGQQIIWQWYNGGSPITTAVISSEATGSTTDKLIFKTTAGGSLGTSLDLTNTLATFSGAIAAADSITIDGVEVAKVVDPVRTTLTGNGSTSVYAIGGASGLTNPSALIVAIDGVLQEPTVDYGVGSGNITFTSPLPNGSKAVVISPTNTIQVGQVTPSDGSVTSSKIASGVTLVSPTLVNTPVFNATDYTYGSGAAVAHRTALGLKTVFAISDESKTPNNTNYIDDSELFLTLEAGTWRVQINAFWSNADNTVGVRAQVSFGGTMDITKSPIIASSGSSTDSNNITLVSTSSRPVGILTPSMPRAILVAATGRNGIIQTDHTVSVSVAGIYRLQWGQGTASSTIAAIRKAGSFITATKLS